MRKITFILLISMFFTVTLVSANSVVINEIMYNPSSEQGSDTYSEWVELYNPKNQNVSLINWTICGNSLLPGYINHTDGKTYLNTTMTIPPFGYAIITDGGTGTEVYDNFNVSFNSTAFHTNKSSICGGLDNSGETISLYNSSGDLIDSITYDGSWGGDGTGYSLEKINSTAENTQNNWAESNVSGGTPGAENQPSTSTPTPSYDLTFKLDINTTRINLYETLGIFGNLTNTYNQTVSGSLTVKIGKESSSGGYDYPENWILVNKEVNIPQNSIVNLTELLGFDLKWNIPDNLISGNYKVYARFKSDVQNRYPYKIFYVNGLGNIFLTSWDITSSKNLALGNITTLNTTVNITNNESNSYDVNLSLVIEDLKTINEGEHDETFNCDVYFIENSTPKMINCTWTLPNNTITKGTKPFNIYPKISFLYENQTIIKTGETKSINITGLEDFGEPELEIISIPDSVRFGDFTTVFVRYSTRNYNFPLRFLSYGYPKQILMDLNGDGVTASSYNSNVVVEVSSIGRNQTIYLTLPLFLKQNCNNYYSDGTYRIRVRAYKPKGSAWEEIITQDFNLTVSGRNNEFCLSTTTTTRTASSGGALTQKKETEKTETETVESPYRIVSYPQIVYVGVEFTSEVELTNDEDDPKELKVYSYIFEGNKLLSEGFDGEKWGRSWTANRKELTLSPGSSVTMTLKNRVKEDVTPGSYKFRVKIKEESKEKNIDEMVEVQIPSPEMIKAQNMSEENTTTSVYTTTTVPEERPITGEVVKIMDKIKEMINSFIEWFKGLFSD